MSDPLKISRAQMKSIIGWFGCFDAVAETINARWGGGACKGTISKKASGILDWTLADVIALEDASGRFPVTRMMARRLEGRVVMADNCLMRQTGAIAKESGEAICAILSAEQSCDADEKAQAITEIDEAIYALRQARNHLEQNSVETMAAMVAKPAGGAT
jgi:D-serine dehydratase